MGPSLLSLLCLNRLDIGWLVIIVTDPPLEPGWRVRVLLWQSVHPGSLLLCRPVDYSLGEDSTGLK